MEKQYEPKQVDRPLEVICETSFQMRFDLTPGDGQSIFDDLTADVRRHNLVVEKLCEDTTKFRSAAATNWESIKAGDIEKLKARRIALLRAEIALRNRIHDWLVRVEQVESPAEVENALAAKEEIKQRVRAGLTALGFKNGESGEQLDRLVSYHPSVHAAIERIERTYAKGVHLAPMSANNTAIKAAQQTLDGLQQRALQGIGI